jgi:site-specific recombinase XerD
MAIEAKAVLLSSLSARLSPIVTAESRDRVLECVAQLLDGFNVEVRSDAALQQDDLLDAYISALQVEGKSAKTIERYRYILTRTLETLGVPVRGVNVYHLRRYLADEKARGISDRTLEGYRQVFSAFFNWLQREGLIQQNPTANLGPIKYAKKIKTTYSAVDMERMKLACTSKRDKAIICFLAATGCRITEMTELNRDDVDLSNLECTVFGKGSKERTVYLDAVAGMVLREYLDERTDDLPALFIGKGTDRITPHGVRFMMTKLQNKCMVDHVHPHKFRTTRATDLIRHGMPIQEVAAILGHEKLDTTMKYVVLDKTDIKNSYRKYA